MLAAAGQRLGSVSPALLELQSPTVGSPLWGRLLLFLRAPDLWVAVPAPHQQGGQGHLSLGCFPGQSGNLLLLEK